MLLAALGLGSPLPDPREAGVRPLSAEARGAESRVGLLLPPSPSHPARRGRQDNLANELVKGPPVTRPGLPSAHLGNSIERLRASRPPPSVAAGGANPATSWDLTLK